MTKRKRSIATLALIKIGIRISIVVLLTSLLSYYFLSKHLLEQQYTTLLNTVTERINHEQSTFPEVENYLKDMNNQIINDSILKPIDYNKQFYNLVELRSDGSYRHKREQFNGKTNSAIYVDDSTRITTVLKERVVRFHHYNTMYGRALSSKYTNLYILGAENYLLVYWPSFSWAEEVTTDYRVWDEPYYSVAIPENNPKRNPVWTPIYFDTVAHDWMVSCIVPIYLKEKHIASSGMDILLNDLITRTKTEILPGTSNIIITHSGDLIVHPDYNENIVENGGKLNVSNCNDPALEKIFEQISAKKLIHWFLSFLLNPSLIP